MPQIHMDSNQYQSPEASLDILSIAPTASDSERSLYLHMIDRAMRDVINGALSEVRAMKGKGSSYDLYAEQNAETALGWIMDDSCGFSHKSHCGKAPCPDTDKFSNFLCQSFKPGAVCQKVTFQEACAYQEPPLSPEAMREQLLRRLRQIWNKAA